MKIGKIIGRVVSTKKVESFEGLKFLLVLPLNENLKPEGEAFVALDMIRCGTGEIVYYETSREGGRVLETLQNPCDAAVMGIIDNITLEGSK